MLDMKHRSVAQTWHSMAFLPATPFTPPLDASNPSYSEAYAVQSSCLVTIFSFVQVLITILMLCGLFISGLKVHPT